MADMKAVIIFLQCEPEISLVCQIVVNGNNVRKRKKRESFIAEICMKLKKKKETHSGRSFFVSALWLLRRWRCLCAKDFVMAAFNARAKIKQFFWRSEPLRCFAAPTFFDVMVDGRSLRKQETAFGRIFVVSYSSQVSSQRDLFGERERSHRRWRARIWCLVIWAVPWKRGFRRMHHFLIFRFFFAAINVVKKGRRFMLRRSFSTVSLITRLSEKVNLDLSFESLFSFLRAMWDDERKTSETGLSMKDNVLSSVHCPWRPKRCHRLLGKN